MNVNEKIKIELYDPLWEINFAREKENVKRAVNSEGISIEHIGSTSIPNMKAKPIIDILIGTANFPPNKKIIEELQTIDYTYMRETSVQNRLYFIKRESISYNVHIVKKGEQIWKDDLAFRDYLRTHKKEADEYMKLKESIIAQGIDTLLEYSSLKASLIIKIIQKAKNG